MVLGYAVCCGLLAGTVDVCLGIRLGWIAQTAVMILVPRHRWNANNLSMFLFCSRATETCLQVFGSPHSRIELNPPPTPYEMCIAIGISVSWWLTYWVPWSILERRGPQPKPAGRVSPPVEQHIPSAAAPEDSDSGVHCFL